MSALFGSPVGGQISPGALAREHRELEGASNCVQCHGLKGEPMAQRCLTCHRDIAALMQDNRGYHGREVKAGRQTCTQCHPDHAGLAFRMIEWPGGAPATFDHRKTGWPLDGAHLDTKCEGCHASRFRSAPAAALSKRKSSAGWIGLETACISCHRDADVHKGELKAPCESCHETRAWAPAPKFDHDRSDYPLTGRHVDVKCEACHVTARLPVRVNADGKRVGVFKPVPFHECSSCHTDPHRGSLGGRCASCHVTRGFAVIDKAGFDHQATRYPLRGKHTVVSCDGCHGANLANRTPSFATCATCHRDVHGGEGTLGGQVVDCERCHSVTGFAPSTYTVAQHQRAKYALDGKHTTVKCGACHTPGPATVDNRGTSRRPGRLRPGSSSCSSCHQDAHAGELAKRADGGACESCHVTAGFVPSTFAASAHATLSVSLDGRHGRIPCSACHGPTRAGLPPLPVGPVRQARLTLHIAELECASCHVDPHAGRYAARGALPLKQGCAACHNAVQWRPATITSALHAGFTFPLEGGHRAVPCVGCHEELKARQAPSTLVLANRGVAALPFTAKRSATCASCHQSSHGAQFEHRKDRGACEGCHTVAAFSPATFDHERDATFSLRGAHARVPCASCHRAATPGGPVAWRPVASKCESCHATPPRRAS